MHTHIYFFCDFTCLYVCHAEKIMLIATTTNEVLPIVYSSSSIIGPFSTPEQIDKGDYEVDYNDR